MSFDDVLSEVERECLSLMSDIGHVMLLVCHLMLLVCHVILLVCHVMLLVCHLVLLVCHVRESVFRSCQTSDMSVGTESRLSSKVERDCL